MQRSKSSNFCHHKLFLISLQSLLLGGALLKKKKGKIDSTCLAARKIKINCIQAGTVLVSKVLYWSNVASIWISWLTYNHVWNIRSIFIITSKEILSQQIFALIHRVVFNAIAQGTKPESYIINWYKPQNYLIRNLLLLMHLNWKYIFHFLKTHYFASVHYPPNL